MASIHSWHPDHLDTSELAGETDADPRSWDDYYEGDLERDYERGAQPPSESERQHDLTSDLSDLESWFEDVGAPKRTLAFLTSAEFPLSPNHARTHKYSTPTAPPSVLDLGTGNGSTLFSLRLEGGYNGPMVGVDFSTRSIELARQLWSQHSSAMSTSPLSSQQTRDNATVSFEVLDIIYDTVAAQPWWPSGGFDLVLDKGTFDAVSLSADTIRDVDTDTERRICELYPAKVLHMVKPGGFFLLTSCNWTETEVIRWFTSDRAAGVEDGGGFDVFKTIRYPSFQFGGQKGQGVASVCFRRRAP